MPIDPDELVWRLYSENREFVRFHENQRATVTGLVGAVSAGLVAAMLSGGGIDNTDAPFALLVLLITILGTIISMKSTEKLRRHNARAKKLIKEINPKQIDRYIEIIKNSDKEHESEYWIMSSFKQSTVWLSINYLLNTFAILLLCITIFI